MRECSQQGTKGPFETARFAFFHALQHKVENAISFSLQIWKGGKKLAIPE